MIYTVDIGEECGYGLETIYEVYFTTTDIFIYVRFSYNGYKHWMKFPIDSFKGKISIGTRFCLNNLKRWEL